ncbi:MAG: hypothetical protein IID32_03475 [Planctomycetes bacterium]|nr:hypothetical protein [Planctomycetota bacterium]
MKMPPLVDLQVNGFEGVDFSSPKLSEEDFVRSCRAIGKTGTGAFLATMITSPLDVYRRNLPLMAQVMEREDFQGRLLGFHLEGPFLNPQDGAIGAHNPDWVCVCDRSYLKQLNEWAEGKIRLITIAADVEGAEELCGYAVEHGITVSLGHHLAGTEELDRLVRAGATALTHLGNALPKEISRHENPLLAGLAHDSLCAMFISDGHHVPPAFFKTIIRTKGVARCIVVSDVAPIGGFAPGRYQTLGNEVVLDESGRLYNPKTGYMVGSSRTLLECMNVLAALDLAPPEALVAMASVNPLKLIGIDRQQVQAESVITFDATSKTFRLIAES